MKKYILDTNIYISADRNEKKADELAQFYSAFLPFTYLHATVAQEILAGARDPKRGRQIQESYVTPFEQRGRTITPTFRTWQRSGEVLASLLQKRLFSPGFQRSFLNDVLLAVSCREFGTTLITANEEDFLRIQQVEVFDMLTSLPPA